MGAIRTAFVLGTQRGRNSLKNLIFREVDIETYAKKAKKLVDTIEDQE